MSTITPNITQEKQELLSSEKILNLLRQELFDKGMAQGKVDQFIVQNQEKLGVDKGVIDLIEAKVSETEIVSEEKVEKLEPSQVESKNEKVMDVESEMKKVKEEISSEEDKNRIEISSSTEEKEKVEQKKLGPQTTTGKKIKIDGYSLSLEIAQDSDKISSKGDVNESKTEIVGILARKVFRW
jgi:hypothetical protein